MFTIIDIKETAFFLRLSADKEELNDQWNSLMSLF